MERRYIQELAVKRQFRSSVLQFASGNVPVMDGLGKPLRPVNSSDKRMKPSLFRLVVIPCAASWLLHYEHRSGLPLKGPVLNDGSPTKSKAGRPLFCPSPASLGARICPPVETNGSLGACSLSLRPSTVALHVLWSEEYLCKSRLAGHSSLGARAIPLLVFGVWALRPQTNQSTWPPVRKNGLYCTQDRG